ncbi:MAG: OmpA family protein [Sporocytophaga sp.]|uniref:OmpA family protein n=1 Tax=Sporocytophaga sp. TaxID=2231183 RepID=UPI001B116E33|nr:OmpA family protein [Sporocytophaga sp.]MBO9702810.1 OmpA family protein [Sporocytophaga sp.]
MKIISTFSIVLMFISTSYGQKFTLQDTVFNNGDVLISHDIRFDFNKATIRSENFPFLDSIASFLLKNKNIAIEVSNHCDERISDYYSTCLTCKRARAIADYLVSKGVKADRLIAKGYNANKPLIKGAITEEEHQQNRRTEFKIIRTDYIE